MKQGSDYIIVGGGPKRCVLAVHLCENPEAWICLIETGKRDTNLLIHMLIGLAKMTTDPLTWWLTMVPQKYINKQKVSYV
ncbi:GMC family oxidoreductase N-terminal domain-containing protein [Acetobacter senegalensis]|uniref:GMC family oxidoreductase N-terminal domain-containing protein n=1 Tax=Acetobacter senegalensis TaxID=446692 RepID=UPI001EDAA560|nr:GMC family oxidoreductase N-terminal domain-containing protein [Acetobacter senegalensis]